MSMSQHVQPIVEDHWEDLNGNPAGGETDGMGFKIAWQNGPTATNPRNGAFVEEVIQACIGRIRFYQTASERRFACRENALALTHLEEALHWLHHRTADRINRGVEGHHTP